MAERVVHTERLPVVGEPDVVAVRGRVRELAVRCGFDRFAVSAITTATSELTRNTWVHGGGGEAEVHELESGGRRGLRITFRDDGPGIADVPRALSGGFSTTQTLGMGMSGSRRLVDEFHIDSVVGRGTVVTIAKWARFSP